MTHIRFIAPLLFTGLLTTSPWALSQSTYMTTNSRDSYALNAVDSTSSFAPGGSYGDKVGNKALNAFSNLTTSVLEIPKNMINVSNQSNFFYGVTGGVFKGLINMLGRMGVGVADLVTIPLATRPITEPVYVWDNFDQDTLFGPAFRLDESPESAPPVTAVEAPAPTPTVVPAPEPAKDYSQQYEQNYPNPNEQLDKYFKKEMMK
ncbi:MAG: exosortase system-associated protein, TIGR04073 family [Gammaproteobacteria bacterium HGW-Gammaproteobacteria-3]|jgi:putative exosortase-associated protein (TIGR04073 family)|nr:MAG: exosortase system-associated protein, TIGR04073 family [Gammaproteobacteria bacterium HGW-Gammaproteobacteria-3]